MKEKRATRAERSEHSMNNDNIIFNNVSPSRPRNPMRLLLQARSPSRHIRQTTLRSILYPVPSTLESINSVWERIIKKRWQNRPFGYGSSESPLSP